MFSFPILYNENLAVYLFMISSAFLLSLKVCKNSSQNIHWAETVLKSYFQLTVPIATLYIFFTIISTYLATCSAYMRTIICVLPRMFFSVMWILGNRLEQTDD